MEGTVDHHVVTGVESCVGRVGIFVVAWVVVSGGVLVVDGRGVSDLEGVSVDLNRDCCCTGDASACAVAWLSFQAAAGASVAEGSNVAGFSLMEACHHNLLVSSAQHVVVVVEVVGR